MLVNRSTYAVVAAKSAPTPTPKKVAETRNIAATIKGALTAMIGNKAISTTVTVPSTGEAKRQGLVKALSQLELCKALYKAFRVKKIPTAPVPIVISKATVAPTEPCQKLECFYCHLKGHYARNCRTQKKAKKAAAAAIPVVIKAMITPVTNDNKYKPLEEKEDGPTSGPTSSPTLLSLPLNSLRRPALRSGLDQASPPSHSPT